MFARNPGTGNPGWLNKRHPAVVGLLLIVALTACSEGQSQTGTASVSSPLPTMTPLLEKVLTADEQARLTPEEILKSFQAGNDRFMRNDLTLRDHSAQVRKAAAGQFPKAVVLSCLDSRIPVEEVLDRGIGDVFVARVAGNIVNEDILGSMEYGCKVSGAKVIMVMGHKSCGAIKSAIDNVKLGNITALLAKIRPAVDGVSSFNGDQTSKNDAFVDAVAQLNVKLTLENIRKGSAILKEMEAKGTLRIIGAFYDIDTGRISFLD
jgi:carbonic anhydrase